MRYSMQIDDRFMVLMHALGEKLCRCPLQTVIYENSQHKAILMVTRHAKWRLGHPCETVKGVPDAKKLSHVPRQKCEQLFYHCLALVGLFCCRGSLPR